MDFGIKGKRAFVIGGASGIGGAIVSELAAAGVKVAFVSRNEEYVKKTLNEIGGNALGHYAIVADISREGAPENICKEVADNFGNADIIVNNVGDTLGILDPLCSISDWRRLFRLNLEVHIEVNNFFIPYMKQQK